MMHKKQWQEEVKNQEKRSFMDNSLGGISKQEEMTNKWELCEILWLTTDFLLFLAFVSFCFVLLVFVFRYSGQLLPGDGYNQTICLNSTQ